MRILQNYNSVTKMERKSFESWWLYISEETAIKNIISCTEITELKNLSKFLDEVK